MYFFSRLLQSSLCALRSGGPVSGAGHCFWCACVGLIIGLPGVVAAMQTLSENELQQVVGRDGLAINLQSDSGINADQVRWVMDSGAVDGSGTSLENSLRIGKAGVPTDGLSLSAIAAGGVSTTDPLNIDLTIDAFTNQQGRAGLGIQGEWQRMRLALDSLSVSDDSRSFGSLAFDSSGQFMLLGDGGLFNRDGDHAVFALNIGDVDASDADPANWVVNDPAQLFYRMGGPGSLEVQLNDLGFLFNMQQGTLALDGDGLLLQSAPGSRTDFNLSFDVFANAFSQFQSNPATDLPLLFLGWRGGLEDFEFRLKPGGAWLPDGTVTEGLTTSIGFNLADDFQFIAGEAGADRSFIEFTDPQSLPSSLNPGRKDVELAALTLDAVSAGQGVGGLCYGGTNVAGPLGGCSAESFSSLPAQLITISPSADGVAAIVRGGGVHAYSSKVSYRDATDSALDIVDQGWALIATLGRVDGNVFLAPQTGGGITMDAVVAVQTLGSTQQERWQNGSHFMIGDTDIGMAIGLVGADMLFATENMDIGLSLADGGLRFLSNDGTRIQLRGMFGGGDIPNMATPVNLSYVDMNLEFDQFAFGILPDIFDKKSIGFNGFFSFADLNNGFSNQTGGAHGGDDGSFISLAEPDFDQLGVDFRLANITGDIEIPAIVNQGGKIDLISASEASDNVPRLRIESRMKIGLTATAPDGSQGDPFMINSVEFGNQKLGAIAMPAGEIFTAITLKPQ